MRAAGPLDSFGTILSGLAKRLGLESRLLELRLQREWKGIVGEAVGSHTWPEHIRFKKLHLIVRSSVWMQQLTFLKPALLAKINDVAGTQAVTDLAMRVGELQPPQEAMKAPTSDEAVHQVPDAALTEATACTATIRDQQLREHLVKVMAEAFSRAGK